MRTFLRQAGFPSKAPLDWRREETASAYSYHCSGAFSFANHFRLDELAQEIRLSGAAQIVLDLREVVYMDSAGVGVLATICRDARERRREFLVVPTPDIRALVNAANLHNLVRFTDSAQAASGA